MSIEIIAEIANAHQGNYKEALRLGLAADGQMLMQLSIKFILLKNFYQKIIQDMIILKNNLSQKNNGLT